MASSGVVAPPAKVTVPSSTTNWPDPRRVSIAVRIPSPSTSRISVTWETSIASSPVPEPVMVSDWTSRGSLEPDRSRIWIMT